MTLSSDTPELIRLVRPLADSIRVDLARPHPFAGERVGFAFAREGGGLRGRIILIHTYEPLDDDAYLEDGLAPASYSGAAIRRVRQRLLDQGGGAFHVHMHEHTGLPNLSRLDRRSLSEVIPSFRGVATDHHCGALLLSDDLAAAWVWTTRTTVVQVPVTVVGYPMRLGDRT